MRYSVARQNVSYSIKISNSAFLRYLSEINICERLLRFPDVSSDKTSDGLSKHVQQVLSELECVKKLSAKPKMELPE